MDSHKLIRKEKGKKEAIKKKQEELKKKRKQKLKRKNMITTALKQY